MPKGKKLTKIKFMSIRRDVRAADEAKTFNALDIAKKHGVSYNTVYKVRNAKTWPGYVADKQRGDAPKVASAAKRFEAAQQAGLNPVRPKRLTVRQVGQVTVSKPTDPSTLIDITPVVDIPYITRGELREEIRAVHSRVDVLSDVLRGLNRDPLFRALFGRKVRGIIAQRDESQEVA